MAPELVNSNNITEHSHVPSAVDWMVRPDTPYRFAFSQTAMNLYFDLPLFIARQELWFGGDEDIDPEGIEAIEYYFAALCDVLKCISLGRPEGLDIYVRKEYIQGASASSVLESYIRVKVQTTSTGTRLLAHNENGSTQPLKSSDVFVGPEGHHPGPVFSSDDL